MSLLRCLERGGVVSGFHNDSRMRVEAALAFLTLQAGARQRFTLDPCGFPEIALDEVVRPARRTGELSVKGFVFYGLACEDVGVPLDGFQY